MAKKSSKPVVAPKDKSAPMVISVKDSRSKQNEAARAALASLQARIAADRDRLSSSPSDQAPTLSLKAAQLHRRSVLRQAEADLAANIAEQRRATRTKEDKGLRLGGG